MGGFGDMFGTIGGFATGEPGGFMNLLGPGGMGLTGSTSKGTAQVLLDPTTQALNALRLNNLQNFGDVTQGFGGAVPAYLNSLQFTPGTQDMVNQTMAAAQVPGVQPQDWFTQAMQNINPAGEEARLNQLQQQGSGYLNDIMSSELNAAGQSTGNTLGMNLGGLQALAPQLLGAGNDYFRQILQPQLQNQSSLMGLGRSGSNAEAQAKGAASISLPIAQLMAQLTQQAYGNYGNQLSGMQSGIFNSANQGQQALLGQNQQAQGNLSQQYMQGIYGINQAYPGVSQNILNNQVQRGLMGVNASDLQRQAMSQGLQNILQGYISTTNQTPYTPAPTQNTTGTGNKGLLDTVMGGGGGAGVGSALGAAMI